MRYSWELGEVTDGFEWYDGYDKEKAETKLKKEDGKGFVKLLSFMSLFLIASYFAGAVISADGVSPKEENDENHGGAVAVMSYGIANADSIEENENDARIEELAAAYIEEYMYENYGTENGGEE